MSPPGGLCNVLTRDPDRPMLWQEVRPHQASVLETRHEPSTRLLVDAWLSSDWHRERSSDKGGQIGRSRSYAVSF